MSRGGRMCVRSVFGDLGGRGLPLPSAASPALALAEPATTVRLPGLGQRDDVHRPGVRHLHGASGDDHVGTAVLAVPGGRDLRRRPEPDLRPARADQRLGTPGHRPRLAADPDLQGTATAVRREACECEDRPGRTRPRKEPRPPTTPPRRSRRSACSRAAPSGYDMEQYSPCDISCRTAVLTFLSVLD